MKRSIASGSDHLYHHLNDRIRRKELTAVTALVVADKGLETCALDVRLGFSKVVLLQTGYTAGQK